MAVSGFTTWEVQTGGSDTNGGGFVEGSSGTDYSQQTSAQLSLSDGMCMGTTNLNSSTGGFTSAMVGNILYLYSSTSMTAEWYEITAYVDTNNVTLDRSGPYDGGMTINVGGCLATPGGAGQASTNSGASAYGHNCWIKSGTYTLSNSVANTSGGPWNHTTSRVLLVAGYNTTRGDLDGQADQTNKPIIDVGTQTSITVLNVNPGSYSYMTAIKNIVVDGQSQTSIIGFAHNISSGYGSSSININCHAIDCTAGFSNASYSCEASGCGTGFSSGTGYDCVAHSGTTGFTGSAVRCLAYENTTGFNSGAVVVNCTAADNTGSGFIVGYTDETINCLSVGNGTGFQFDGSRRCGSFNMVVYNNTTDFNWSIDSIDDTRHWNELHTLTADPFTDAANDDYSLNDTAGGGAVLKQLGLSIPGQTNDTPDFGAVQTNITAGGATFHPLAEG